MTEIENTFDQVRNQVQDLDNRVEENNDTQRREMETMSTTIEEIQRRLEYLESLPRLDRSLSEDGKRIIRDAMEDIYKVEDLTVAAGFTIAPSSRFLRLTGTASRTSDTTTAISDGGFEGQLLILEGTHDTNTIIIKDSANTDLGGADVTLGANDLLTLLWDGTDWIRLNTTDN